MQYSRLITLLPCHSIEDFPVHAVGSQAESLLAAWCAFWHPELIAHTGRPPIWCKMDDLDQDTRDALLVLPAGHESASIDDIRRVATQGNNLLIEGQVDRTRISDTALATIQRTHEPIDGELVADFFALAYWYLQVQLLTRQMRYSSHLDEQHFEEQLVQAAKSVTANDVEQAKEHLSRCFSVLAEERDHYYPVDAFLIDLTLVAPTICGEPLRQELLDASPANFLLSGATLEYIASHEPESFELFRQAISDDRAAIIGGEIGELPLPMLSCELLLDQLRKGAEVFSRHLDKQPTCFGRRRFGLTPRLPQLLEQMGYRSALHATLDDGRFPESNQARTRWEGLDGTTIEGLCCVPLDAARPETFLNLATRMGESMEMDYVATVCLAHWPARASHWYEDLRRGAKYGLALGRFATVEQYFDETSYTGQLDRFEADQYRSPYLKQMVDNGCTNPISTWIDHWRQEATSEMTRNLRAWVQMLNVNSGPWQVPLPETHDPSAASASVRKSGDEHPICGAQADAAFREAAERLAATILPNESHQVSGTLAVNPTSVVRRVAVRLEDRSPPAATDKSIYAAGIIEDRATAVVDVPGCGFVWVGDGTEQPDTTAVNTPPLAAAHALQNEFLKATIDPETGGIRSIFDFSTRGNRISQQLAFRFPGESSSSGQVSTSSPSRSSYSTMKADTIAVTRSTSLVGEITSFGKLLDAAGNTLAEFEQRYELWRGSRVLEIGIRLDTKQEPGDDPWNSYFACRFAWPSEHVDLYHDVNQARQPGNARRLEAPLYIDVEDGKRHTTILSGGTSFHRRIGSRRLDTLLVVRGESRRTFRLGIAVEPRSLLADATAMLVPCVELPWRGSSGTRSSWLFHIDARNVVATYWQPLLSTNADNVTQCDGFRVRLLESVGRAGQVTLHAYRPILSARRLDFRGGVDGNCEVVDGRLQLRIAAHQWAEIEARW